MTVLCTFGVMAAGRGVGLGYGCLTVGMWDFHVCVSACMRGRTLDGVRVYDLRRRLNSVVYVTHTAYIASTKAILSIASIMTNNQNILENVGGVDANSLCQLLNNNDDNDNPDDDPNIVQMSSYYDDDSLNNLFKDKGN